MTKTLRWITVAVVGFYFLDTLFAAVAGFCGQGPVGAATMFQQMAAPFGIALVAGIHLWQGASAGQRVKSSADADAVAKAEASQSQQANPTFKADPRFEPKIEIHNNIQSDQELDEAKIRAIMRSVLSEAPSPSDCTAQRYFIRDAEGNPRGMFGVTEDGAPMLAMLNSNHELTFAAVEREGNPELILNDEQGRRRMTLAVFDTGPRLSLSNGKGAERVVLTQIDKEPEFAGLSVLGIGEKHLVSLFADPDGGLLGVKGKSAKEGILISPEGIDGQDANGNMTTVWRAPKHAEDTKD